MDTNDNQLQRLGEANKIPLYANAKVSFLGAFLVCLKIWKKHGMLNACVDELMRALSSKNLPHPNSHPSIEQEASRLLKVMGLGCKVIYACLKRCFLLKGVVAHLNCCPKCSTPSLLERNGQKAYEGTKAFPNHHVTEKNVWLVKVVKVLNVVG